MIFIDLCSYHDIMKEPFCLPLTTAAIHTNICREMKRQMHQRDSYVTEELGVYTNTCDLPRLLMSRQIDGSTFVLRQALLLKATVCLPDSDFM